MIFHQQPHTFVSHVSLKVAELDRSLAFYQNIIGFQILKQEERRAILTANGSTPLLTIEQPEQVIAKQSRTTGLYHFALLLPERTNLAQIVQHFIGNGVRFGSSDHLVSEALYLQDPDGNGIEVYADRLASTWHWQNGEILMDTIPLDFDNLLEEVAGIDSSIAWEAVPANTIMGHIHLHVANLKQAETFYCQGLGFDIVSRFGEQATFMSTGGYHHHIAINTWAGVGAPPAEQHNVGLKEFSLVYPSESARNEVIERLQHMGIMVEEGQSDQIWIVDPSANRIQLLATST